MSRDSFHRMTDLPSAHLLGTGTPMCAGCGGLEAVHQIYNVLGTKNIIVNSAGCMTLLSVYPYTPFQGSWLYTAMASAPAGAQGVRDALDILIQQGRLREDDDLEVLVLTGDGSAYGMGLSAASAASARNLNFIYICYDNEGYGNTGQQYSAATPHGAHTSMNRTSFGYPGYKKELFNILVAHRPSYAATVIGSEPVDLAQKIERAKSRPGDRFVLALSPCPTGWGFDPKETVAISKLAVRTGIWPLKEYRDNRIVHTRVPRDRLPVEAYLKTQGRYEHLFVPKRNERLISEIQARVDAYWQEATD